MKASVVDIRYKMNDILKALDRNEDVELLYRGQPKGVLTATGNAVCGRVVDHPFFNMMPAGGTVEEEMDRLRGGRHRDL